MIKNNNVPLEQRAQEEALPVSLDHEDLQASEMESVSGGVAPTYTVTCRCLPTSHCSIFG
jgi:hypothetical protein